MTLSMTDIELFRIVILAVAMLLLPVASERIRRATTTPAEYMRNVVHACAGFTILLFPLLFSRASAVAIFALLLVISNFFAFVRNHAVSKQDEGRSRYYTVYYPLSLVFLAVIFWEPYYDLVVACILIASVADAVHFTIGIARSASSQFRVTNAAMSVERSLALFIIGTPALMFSLMLYGDGGLRFGTALVEAPFGTTLACAAIVLFATAWEAISQRGLDKLSIPLMTAFALHVCFIDDSAIRFITGAALGLGVAIAAYRFRLLAVSGAVAAFLLAVVVYGIGEWMWSFPILAFFILSSFLSHWRKSQKQAFNGLFEKSGIRDAGQVAANGAVAGILAFAWYFVAIDEIYLLYLVALATVTADTWGTEIGILSRGTVRNILTFKTTTPGTSGGISIAGTAGGAAGALVIALTSFPFDATHNVLSIAFVTLAGIVGSTVDSILGATLQAQYHCTKCGTTTERRTHCNTSATLLRGHVRITNDIVNFASTCISVSLTTGMLLLVRG